MNTICYVYVHYVSQFCLFMFALVNEHEYTTASFLDLFRRRAVTPSTNIQ